MFKSKIIIIFLGALSVTLLLNFQRMVIAIQGNSLSSSLGLTKEVLIFRMILMFGYACLLLGVNLSWKNNWFPAPSVRQKLSLVAVNSGILLLGIIVAIALKLQHSSAVYEQKQIIFATVINYLVVHPILLLLARFINLTFKQQQNLLEKEQAKQKALQHQLAAIRSQINPHFLFNSLDSLTALIREQSDRALAFVDQLSWLLRSTLQRSNEDFLPLAEEWEYLESYIFLQKERFGEKFKVDIRIPDDWKKESVPSFSLQLLVENAIKHNIASSKQPLMVEIFPENEQLKVRNRIQKRGDAPVSTGTGLANLSVRFRMLKKRDIQILQDEHFFTVSLPIKSHESDLS
ncbi:MAG: histidine kinase [Bacteroidota bacterium]